MDTYFARLCWNSQNWVRPTGEARKLENRSYATDFGFGHEEWLFNLAWELDGSHFGFLQPVNLSRARLAGTSINLVLHTIAPGSTRLLVGEIRECHILTDEEIAKAAHKYKRNGWHAEMIRQVREVGGMSRELTRPGHEQWMFNIRFRTCDVVMFSPHRIPPTSSPARRSGRYILLPADMQHTPTKRRGKRATASKSTGTLTRSGTEPVRVKRVHNKLQNRLQRLLATTYGKHAVKMEEDNVDLRVDAEKRFVFIEVKSDPRPRMVLRDAIGQLLEYADIEKERSGRTPELVAVGPGVPTPDTGRYLAWLAKTYGLRVAYRQFTEGSRSFDI